jgi:hypothetical protein
MKSYVLYFDSEGMVKLERRNVKDGNIVINDKSFDVDSFVPRLLKTRFGVYPIYMLKWDTINPPINFNPTFNPDKSISPEIYHKTMKMKILGNMLKVKKETNVWMMIAIGVAFGVFVMYYLVAMGVLKV